MIPCPLAEQSLSSPLVAGAFVLGVVLVVWSTRRRFARRQPDPADYLDTYRQQLREQSDIRQQMQELLVEIQSYVRDMSARLDTKAARLEALIQSAQQQIQRLEELQAATARGRQMDVVVDEDPTVAPPADEAQGSGTLPADDPVRAQIYTLADQGRSPVQIARATGLPTGQVELILALRRTNT